MYFVNTVLVAGVITLQLGGSPLRRWWKSSFALTPTEYLAHLAQLGFGLLAAVIADVHSWALVLLVIPTAAVYSALTYHIHMRRIAETGQLEAEKRYQTLVEQMPTVTYIDSLDSSRIPIYRSPQIEQMTGAASVELVGDPVRARQVVHPDDRRRLDAERTRVDESSGDSFSFEYRLIRGDGRSVWVRDEAVLVRGEDSTPLHWQGVLHDITDRQTLQDQLQYQAPVSQTEHYSPSGCAKPSTRRPKTAACWRSCSLTSTASKLSTTHWVTKPATTC